MFSNTDLWIAFGSGLLSFFTVQKLYLAFVKPTQDTDSDCDEDSVCVTDTDSDSEMPALVPINDLNENNFYLDQNYELNQFDYMPDLVPRNPFPNDVLY